MFDVRFHKNAFKYYESLDDKTVRRINAAIERIRVNPREGHGIKKLTGRLQGRLRCRVGDLRIVYRIDNEKELVVIEAIGPRGDIYK